jgi:hypothetical protein
MLTTIRQNFNRPDGVAAPARRGIDWARQRLCQPNLRDVALAAAGKAEEACGWHAAVSILSAALALSSR